MTIPYKTVTSRELLFERKINLSHLIAQSQLVSELIKLTSLAKSTFQANYLIQT